MTALTERFEMRLDAEMISRIDEWRDQEGDGTSRAEAIRRLIDLGLEVKSRDTVHFTDGEKLLLLLMGDLFKHLGVENPETDIDFIKEVIFGGHFWGPTWGMPGVFHGHRDDPGNVTFVVSVMDMWSFLERGHKGLSDQEKKRVEQEAEPLGKSVRFRGFDGNREAELIGIARFLIERLDRFTEFRDRDLNSHMPTGPAYRRMLDVYEPARPGLVGRELNADEIIEILRAWRSS